MQVEIDIEFNEILRIVKTLPSGQLRQLESEIEKKKKKSIPTSDLETLLLKGPVATKSQLETISKNRKAINQWRRQL